MNRIAGTMVMVLFGLAVLCGPVRAETHIVTVANFTFDPVNLIILVGDTVRWERTEGVHTVTSGTGAADPQVGAFFDAQLDMNATSVEVTFVNPGMIPYFCRPHELFGMKANLIVEAPVATEPTTWSRIKGLFKTEVDR